MNKSNMIVKESNYVTPAAKTVEIKAQNIICGSDMQSSQTERYEVIETEDWF